MSDWDKVALAFDILEGAEMVYEFEDRILIAVDGEMWRDFVLLSEPKIGVEE